MRKLSSTITLPSDSYYTFTEGETFEAGAPEAADERTSAVENAPIRAKSGSITLEYDHGFRLNLHTDRISLSDDHPLMPTEAQKLWTAEERALFWRDPLSLKSVSFVLRGFELYRHPNWDIRYGTRNVSLIIASVLGLGPNTAKWMLGDNIPISSMKDEMLGNVLALLPLIGLVRKAATMLKAETAALEAVRIWRAERPFLPEMALIEDTRMAQKAFASRFSETPVLRDLWNEAARDVPNTSRGFDAARAKFWKSINNGTSKNAQDARKILRQMGYELQGGSNAPLLKMKGWDKRATRELADRILNVEHADPQSLNPARRLDSSNLRFMSGRDNSFRGNGFNENDFPRR